MIRKKRLGEILKNFGSRKVTVIGETMLDKFIRGRVQRISPEAPVPVVKVDRETQALGGAGNVAVNLSALGARVSLVTATGEDEAGEKISDICRRSGLPERGILKIPGMKTIEKTRIIAEHQQVVRFDKDPAGPGLSSREKRELLGRLAERMGRDCGALVLSDYGKGMFTPDIIRATIKTALKNRVPVCVDPKAEHFKRYKNATCVTPNVMEAFQGMLMPPKTAQEAVETLGAKIMKTLNLESLLITQGENGMTLFRGKGKKSVSKHIPTRAREVYDVTGAGDTVIAAFALSLAAGASFTEAASVANYAAGVVVAKLGTAAVSRDEIIEHFSHE